MQGLDSGLLSIKKIERIYSANLDRKFRKFVLCPPVSISPEATVIIGFLTPASASFKICSLVFTRISQFVFSDETSAI